MTENIESEVEVPVDENPANTNFAPKPGERNNTSQPQGQPVQTQQEPAQSDTTQTEDGFDPEQEGIEEAKEEKNNAPGETEAEKTQNALESKYESLQNFQKGLQQAKQRITEMQEYRNAVQETVTRVENASNDEVVMEHLDSQLASIEVKPSDRDDYINRLEGKVDDANTQISQIQERGETLQKEGAKTEIACKWLDQHLSNIQG